MLPGEGAPPISAQGWDIATFLIALAPLVLFLVVLVWALKSNARKKRAIEASYNLIALELLLFLILPVCDQPFDCAYWTVIPVFMFATLIAYMYYRKQKEKQHQKRVSKAMSDGHIDKTDLIQGKLERDLVLAKNKPVGKLEIKQTPELKKLEQLHEAFGDEEPIEEKKEPEVTDHRKIERVIEKVVKKKGKKS